MAAKSMADSHQELPIDTFQQQSVKDFQGSDSSIPLSPQWLQNKTGDYKDYHIGLYHGDHTDHVKGSGTNDDSHEFGKRKGVYKLQLHDSEIERCGQWRDEERETSPAVRRDRWREGDKEFSDARKGECWSDNSMRYSGEARHTPSKHWGDLSNREGSFDHRRESKWSTRWGPDDKESESWRDKRLDSVKVGEGPREKAIPHLNSQPRDTDKEGEQHSHLWRSNSSMAWGKAEQSHHQLLTPNKQIHFFGYGRGKGETGKPALPAGRGKFNSNGASGGVLRSHNFGATAKSDRIPVGASPVRYSRMRLLDIYRMTDISGQKISNVGFVEVPSLSEAELVEPLALSAPTAEEVVILKAIDKGEIVSSGVPQVSKEGSIGRKAADAVVLKQMKSEGHEDKAFAGGDHKYEDGESIKTYDDTSPKIEPVKQRQGASLKNTHEFSGERSMLDGLMSPNTTPLSSQSVDRSHLLSHDWNDNAVDRGSRSSMGNCSYMSGEMENETADATFFSSFRQDESSWQSNQNDHENRSNSNFRSRPAAKTCQLYLSPEELSLYYKDPHGQVQGPFSGTDLINWFEAGYFGIDLQVRLANAPTEAPFLFLGDVIPQLRLKVGPPPGFATARQSGILHTSNKVGSTVSSVHSGLGDFNRFSETLLSANLTSQMENLSEGILHATLGERGNAMNYVPIQKRLLEQKNSLPNALQFFSGDTSYQASQSMQQVDLISPPNAGQVDKPISPAVSFGALTWSNLSDAQVLNTSIHGGIENSQSKIDLHHNPQIGFVGQQQPADHSGLLPSEKLISADVINNPEMLNLLHQHYLLSNPFVNSQVSLPSQLSLLNECFLLKQQLELQQHRKEQQQQLLLMQRQILLSQVFSGHQLSSNVGDSSCHKLHSDVSGGNVLADHLLLQGQNAYVNENMPTGNLQNGIGSAIQNVNFQDNESSNNSLSSATSILHFPHQIFDLASSSKKHGSGYQEVGNNVVSDVSLMPVIAKTLSVSDELQKSMNALASSNKINSSVPQFGECLLSSECSTLSHEVPNASGSVSIATDQINDLKILSAAVEQHHADASAAKDSVKVQASQTKKSAEKKSRKQKNSKSKLALDLLRGFSNTNQVEQPKSKSETEDALFHSSEPEIQMETINPPQYVSSVSVEGTSSSSALVVADFQQSELLPSSDAYMDKGGKNVNKVTDSMKERVPYLDAQVTSNHQPWKPAPGVKAKSLKEIQQEEQQRVQMQKTASATQMIPSTTETTQLSGIIGYFDKKPGNDTLRDASSKESSLRSDSNFHSESRKSQLHDLLAEEVLAKLSEEDADLNVDSKGQLLQPLPSTTSIDDVSSIDHDNFIEAKDTKRSRKKGSKAKVAGAKVHSPVGSLDLSTSTISANKIKSQSEFQKEKELLPAPPTGPSLADFVPRKGDQTSSSQAPAWSVGLGKLQKPTSLRDIQREQEKKSSAQQSIPLPSPGKVQPKWGSCGSGYWHAPGSSPSSSLSPIQSNSLAPRPLKSKVEDDQFWGPVDHSKQESDHPSFLALENSNSWGIRGSLPKAKPVAINRQKPLSSRPAEHVPSSPAFKSPASRPKKDEKPNNLSEAMEFRDWCEKELARLTGMNDTSLLEYCLQQSTAEAEMILKENLGSLDRNHEFIDKFLRFKDFLSTAVIEMAFRTKSSRSETTMNSEAVAAPDFDVDVEASEGEKKKGKKGKKVSPAVLGFNIVSNRIMMGEIQNVDD